MTETVKLDTWVEEAIRQIPNELRKIAQELSNIKSRLN